MFNRFMSDDQLAVRVGDRVSVQGNEGTVIQVVRGVEKEWDGVQYAEVPGTEFTNVRVHFDGDLANWGQYQDGEYGCFSVIK